MKLDLSDRIQNLFLITKLTRNLMIFLIKIRDAFLEFENESFSVIQIRIIKVLIIIIIKN